MKPIVAVPATLALVYRAWSRKSLTPFGIFTAALTAVAHAIHPWSVFFTLLAVFFLAGTAVTKVKHNVKAKLTQSASGAAGGEGARTHVQVLANSLVASVLILLHAKSLYREEDTFRCWRHAAVGRASDVLVSGIVANYAAVAADTFSSELGILSKSQPRLITAPWRKVPPGTNGGVTGAGLLAGLAGSFIISATATLMIPFCNGFGPSLDHGRIMREPGWDIQMTWYFLGTMTFIGFMGSVLDSVLGAWLQASVVDVRSGKIVEGAGGGKVLVVSGGSIDHRAQAGLDGTTGTAITEKEGLRKRGGGSATTNSTIPVHHEASRKVAVGRDILSNNGVNLLMAFTMSVTAIAFTAWLWSVPAHIIWRDL